MSLRLEARHRESTSETKQIPARWLFTVTAAQTCCLNSALAFHSPLSKERSVQYGALQGAAAQNEAISSEARP